MLNPVSDAFKSELQAALPGTAFREVTEAYLTEPRGRYHGRAGLIVAPETVEEVALVVRAANRHHVPVVPYGGGTGLVGGQVAPDLPDPVLLSMARMARVREVLAAENVLIAEGGAILAEVQAAAEAEDRLFPLSYGSEGSARIGAALAVNSGGLNVLRYGSARDLCLGIEAVLPTGEILHGLKRLRKDNTGYDLRHLLIGSEGTLGIITAAALKLSPRPAETGTALIEVASPEAALEVLQRARGLCNETLSAFELISGQGPRFVAEAGVPARLVLEPVPDWMVLIEVGTAADGAPGEVLERLYGGALEDGLVGDGVIARSEAQRAEIWRLREAIPEANRIIGSVASHDVSLPLGVIAEFMEGAEAALAIFGDVRINAFGHLGDGNLHYNVFPAAGKRREDYDGLRQAVTETVHDLVVGMGGSFSAEHGIGRMKVGELERYGDPAKLATMRAIKTALDPNGILNPGAVLRLEDG
jgi:FAD/FMN-containing dehydrogenase